MLLRGKPIRVALFDNFFQKYYKTYNLPKNYVTDCFNNAILYNLYMLSILLSFSFIYIFIFTSYQ